MFAFGLITSYSVRSNLTIIVLVVLVITIVLNNKNKMYDKVNVQIGGCFVVSFSFLWNGSMAISGITNLLHKYFIGDLDVLCEDHV